MCLIFISFDRLTNVLSIFFKAICITFYQKGPTSFDSREQRVNKLRKKIVLALMSAFPIGLGILKVYLHVISRWKLGLLDYVVAAGLIFGGLFLFSRKRPKVVVLISSILIIFEFFKAIVDYYDHFDVFIAVVAILYLSIPILRYSHPHIARPRRQ